MSKLSGQCSQVTRRWQKPAFLDAFVLHSPFRSGSETFALRGNPKSQQETASMTWGEARGVKRKLHPESRRVPPEGLQPHETQELVQDLETNNAKLGPPRSGTPLPACVSFLLGLVLRP